MKINHLIKDCGGVHAVATACNVSPVTVYRWAKTGRVSSHHLLTLKAKFKLDLNNYFRTK